MNLKEISLYTVSISLLILLSIISCKKDDNDKKLPVLTTNEVTEITQVAAFSGGVITFDGGLTITVRGVCWGTNDTPTIIDNKTEDGAGAGSFTSQLTDLLPEATYYVRSYATNIAGTGYGMTMSFKTLEAVLPVLVTNPVTDITATTAISGGVIMHDGFSDIIARGIVWNTSGAPTNDNHVGITNDGTGIGEFNSNLSGLIPNTTYYVRSYATNAVGTTYGKVETFKSQNGIIAIITNALSDITNNSAVTGGNITADGGDNVIACGVVWSSSANPTIENYDGLTIEGAGSGTFVSSITGLTPRTIYYVRAYATNSFGTSYGSNRVFETFYDMITDYDGNSYGTVIIGTQEWMAENLKTTHYRNGTPIENLTGHSDWQNDITGAYVWYNNDISWKGIYGALYNWHVVSNDNGPCPTGWHVPSDVEFTAMTSHLGATNVAGGKMKSTRTVPDPHPRWESPNTGATNESNWTGLPGGFRLPTGAFLSIGGYGSWWSSTEASSLSARIIFLSSDNGSAYWSSYDKARGFSIRCLRD